MKLRSRLALAAVPVAFAVVFFLYPVASIVALGLRPDGSWDLGAIGEVAGHAATWKVVWFTSWQAAVSTGLTLVVALPGAWCFATFDFRAKRLIWALLIVPFVLPTVVVGSAMLGLVGPGSPLGVDLRSTIWAILLAHVFFNYAVVVRTVGSVWANLDPTLETAARTLGAGPARVLRTVTWPAIRPAIAAASSIVFLFTFTSFGVVLLLGGPAHRTLEVEIYTQTARLLNLDKAAVLALVQLGAVVAVLVVYGRYQRRHAGTWRMRPSSSVAARPSGWRQHVFVAANLVVIALLLAAPLLVLVQRSVSTPTGWGLDFYRSLGESKRGSTLFVAPIEAVRNSLVFATAAAALATIVGGLASVAIAARGRGEGVGRWIDLALMVPLGTSAVTVGFGFLIALDAPPLDLRDSVALVPVAHALVAVPFVIRAMVPVLRSIDPRLRESAALLGAGPARTFFTVDFPIVRRALVAGLGFAFAISLGEFGATVFLARADTPTIPVAIYRFLGRPGPDNFGQAMALASVLMAVTAMVMIVVDRLRAPDHVEF